MEEISYRCLYHCRYSRELKTLCITRIILPSTSVVPSRAVIGVSEKMGGSFSDMGMRPWVLIMELQSRCCGRSCTQFHT